MLDCSAHGRCRTPTVCTSWNIDNALGVVISCGNDYCRTCYGYAEVWIPPDISEAGYIEWLRQGLGAPFAFFDGIRTLIGIMGELSVFPLIFSSYLNQLADFDNFGQVWTTMFCVILLSLLINLAG